MKRKGKISRKTKETSISVELNIDGNGKYCCKKHCLKSKKNR